MRFAGSSFLFLVGTSVCFTNSALASRFNVLPGRTGGPANGGATCRSCHGSAVGDGSVEILGAPSQYQANAAYDLTIRVSDAGQSAAGFQLSVEDASGNHIGVLSVIDAVHTELNSDDPVYINHTSVGVDDAATNWVSNGNSASYNVRWTAPATDMGQVTFWAAGNAVNNNFSTSGDFIYTTNTSATFVAVPAVSTWGVMILALGVLTAGTIAGLRRNERPIPVVAN